MVNMGGGNTTQLVREEDIEDDIDKALKQPFKPHKKEEGSLDSDFNDDDESNTQKLFQNRN
jgi:hypothetical protein